MNIPVSIGGQIVSPGDVVVGDEDGLVAFPISHADALLKAVAVTAKSEENIMAEIATGVREQEWLRKVLEPHGLY